jgi:CRP/FNR family transcriptional regulator, cyclic AMP receptor protein
MQEPLVNDLRDISLFSGLSDSALEQVARVAHVRTYQAGETIAVEAEPCLSACFIAEGWVRVYRLSPEGREQVLVRLGPGQTFNTVPPFQAEAVNPANVEAMTVVTLYAVESAAFRHLVTDCPEVTLAVLGDFAERLHHLADLVSDLSLRPVRGRLARFLLEHVNREDQHSPMRWTQEEIAAHIGTVRDVVGRTLRAFVDAGYLGMERQRIVLLDREALEAEANESC